MTRDDDRWKQAIEVKNEMMTDGNRQLRYFSTESSTTMTHGSCHVKTVRFVLSCHSVALVVFPSRSSSFAASSKISASGAPTNVAFPPSPTHLFTALSSAWLSHKYSMGFVTGVKTKTASSETVRAGSFLFASHLPLLPFPLFQQVHIPCSHFPPFLVRSITRCDCASGTVTS